MTTKYVNSGAGGAATGNDWTNAYTTLGAAVTAGADAILVHKAHNESLGADTTYTLTVDTEILCVDKDASDALSTGAIIGSQATNWAITFAGAFKLYAYGIDFRNGTGATAKNIIFSSTDGAHTELESCVINLTGSSTTNRILFGGNGASFNCYTLVKNSTLKFASTSQGINTFEVVDLSGVTIDSGGSAPSTLFLANTNSAGVRINCSGCDFSFITGTLVADRGANGTGTAVLRQCKIGAGVTIKGASATVLNKGNSDVMAFDCNSGDTHISFYHSDAFGETTVSTTYSISDGAQINSTAVSWKIVTTANCSFFTPYTSPWIARPHTGTSAVTASFEGFRAGSTTVYKDDAIWGEWQSKVTASSTQVTTYNDRATPAVTPTGSNQTSTKTYSDWSGGSASDSTFKLSSSSFTPAESGHVFGRIVVGGASLTAYVDPQIRLA